MFRKRKESQGPLMALSLAMLVTPVLSPLSALAQARPGATGGSTPASPGSGTTNLDLSAASATLSAKNQTPVNIHVGGSVHNGTINGGTTLTILPGQLVTPAQYVAVFEAIRGNQTLLVNNSGVASGGSFRLNSSTVQNLAGLLVPAGVSLTAVGYNSNNPLNVSGNTSILGSMFAVQTAPNIVSVLNLANLNVGPGGLLSGSLPAGTNLPGLYSSAGLNLNVAGNLVNQGTITTPGTLNIAATGSISNISAAAQAVMAAQNINISVGSGNIVNSGLIQAANYLNFNTSSPTTNLNINNTNGVLQALGSISPVSGLLEGGVINLRSNDANIELANVSVTGGTIDAASETNVFGKDMAVHVEQIKGAINSTGSVSHVSVQKGDLLLGRQILSGDPTYYNAGGDITISDLTVVGGDLAIVASGDILTTGNTTISTTAADFSVFLSAGYNFTAVPDNSSSSFPANDPGDASSILTFDGTTNPGKNINPAGNSISIHTSGTGTVTMLASGDINLGNGLIDSGSGKISLISDSLTGANAVLNSTNGDVEIYSAVADMTAVTVQDGLVIGPVQPIVPLAGTMNLPFINTGGKFTASSLGTINLGLSTTADGIDISAKNVNGQSASINGGLSDIKIYTSPTGSITNLGPINSQADVYIGTDDGSSIKADSVDFEDSVFTSGNIFVLANNSITQNGVSKSLTGAGITVQSDGDVLMAGTDLSGSLLLTVQSKGDLKVGDLTSPAGVAVDNKSGSFDIVTGNISTLVASGTAGDITISGGKDVTTGSLSSYSSAGNAGAISLTGNSGSVSVNAVDSHGTAGTGGAVTLAGVDGLSVNGGINATASGAGNASGVVDLSVTGATPSLQVTGNIDNSNDSNTPGGYVSIVGKGVAAITLNGSTGQDFVSGTTKSSDYIYVNNPNGIVINNGDALVSETGVGLETNAGSVLSTNKGAINAPLVAISAALDVGSSTDPLLLTGALPSLGVLSDGGIYVSSKNNMIVDGVTVGALSVTGITSINDISLTAPSIQLNSPIVSNGLLSNITLVSDSIDFATSGTLIDAGSNGTVVLIPSTSNVDIAVGGTGNYFDTTSLTQVNAGTLQIGDAKTFSGTITLNDNIVNSGLFNFSLSTSNLVDTNNFSIDGGDKSVSITAGTLTVNAIDTTTGDITLQGINDLTLNGNLTSTGGNISLSSGPGNIIGNSFNITANSGDVIIDPSTGAVVGVGDVSASGNIFIGTSDGVSSKASGISVGKLDNSAGTGKVAVLTQTGGISTGSIGSTGSITVAALSTTNSGDVTVGGAIDNSTGTSSVTVDAATGAITVDAISSSSNIDVGNATAAKSVVLNGALDSSTGAGHIQVLSATGSVNGSFDLKSGSSVTISAPVGSIGDTDPLGNITAQGDVEAVAKNIVSLGGITSTTLTGAGDVLVQGDGTVTVNGNIDATGFASGGKVQVISNTDTIEVNGFIDNTSVSKTINKDVVLQTGSALTLQIGTPTGPNTTGAVTTDGNLTIKSAIVDFSSNTSAGGQIQITADSTTVDDTVVVQGSAISIQPYDNKSATLTVDNSGSLNASNGDINIIGAFGQDLTLTGNGNGSFSVINGKAVNITANGDLNTPGNLNFGPGDMTFNLGDGSAPGATANFSTQNDLNVSSATYSFPNDYSTVNLTFNTFNGNVSDFDLQGQPNSKINITVVGGTGTIANSGGDIDLSTVATLSFSGPIAFLAAGDITNTGGNLTVQSHGNSLTMIAGIDFTPATKGTEGPNKTAYTLTGTSTGGKIVLGNVDIDSSDTSVGGDIFLVASTGSNAGSGSIVVGNITSTGASSSGAVKVLGNNITINGLDSSSAGTAGNVVITSSDKITISNPGIVTVEDGVIKGGTLLPSANLTGSITFGSDLNAGTGSVTILGGDFNSSGTVTANSLTINSAAGSILGQAGGTLNTAVATAINVTATGDIDITNTGDITFAADAGFKLSLNNTGNVTIAGSATVLAGTSIDIVTTSSDTLMVDGNIKSSTGTVNLDAGTIDTNNKSSLITAKTATFTSQTGSIGVSGTINTAITNSFKISSATNVDITNTGNVASLDLTASTAGPGNVSFINVGNLTLSGNLATDGTVSIQLNSNSSFANNGFTISSNSNNISLATDNFAFTAPGAGSAIDAGSATVSIIPASGATAINLGAAAKGLNLTSGLLQSINASTLTIGSAGYSGSINLTSNVDISAQPYALVIDQEGGTASFNTNGFTLDLGANNATVKVATTISLDKVTTAGTNTLLFQGSGVTINDVVGTDGDDITVTTSADIATANSGQITAGILLLSAGGNIGSSKTPLATAVTGSFTADSTLDMFITNNASLAGLQATSKNESVTLVSNGDLTLSGTGLTAAKSVTVQAAVGKTIDFNSVAVTATKIISIKSDSILNAGSFNAGTGQVIFDVASPSTKISLGVDSGGLFIDETALNNSTASKITVGSSSDFGNIELGAPLNLSLGGATIEFIQGDNGTLSGSFVGAGQTISLDGGNISVTTTKGAISVGQITNQTGGVTLQTGGGNITLDDVNAIPDANTINLLAGGVGTGALTGSLIFTTPLPGGLIITPEQAPDGSGGNVALRANNFMNTASANNITSVFLDVSGTGTDVAGGSATFERTAAGAFAPTNAIMTINVGAGSNSGKLGSATISNNGDLTYDPTKGVIITNVPATKHGGAGITLTAGNIGIGNLLVTGDLLADGSGDTGGSITLNSNSTTSFLLGNTSAKNGTKGGLSVAGTPAGNITVTNRGGGITFASTTAFKSAVANLKFDTSGAKAGTLAISKPLTATSTITLNAGGTGTINPGSNVLTAPTIALTAQTGAITAKINTSKVSASTTGPTGTAAVNLTSTATAPLTVDTSSSIGTFSVSHAGAITTSGKVSGTAVTIKTTSNLVGDNITLGADVTATSSTGSVTIQSPKASILRTGTGTITGKTVTLSAPVSAGSVGTPLKVSAASLSETAADAYLENTAFGTSALTVTSAKATNVFSLKSTSAIVLTSSLTNAKNVVLDTSTLPGANGNITVNGSIGLTTATTGITILSSQSILGSGTLSTKTGQNGVIMQTGASGNVGTSTAPIKTNTDKIALLNSTTGLINLSDANTTGATVNSALVAGGIVKVAASGPMTFVGNVIAGNSGNGSVTITTKGTTVFNGKVNATGTGTLGSVSVTQTGGGQLQLNGGTASNLFSVSTTGAGINVNPGNDVSATNITLKTTGTNSSLSLGSKLLATPTTGVVNLTAAGTGNISGTQLVQGGSITFTTGTGNVGVGAGNELKIAASTVSVKSTGAVFLNNQGLSTLTVAAANPNNKSFELLSTSAVAMTATLSTASDITISASGGIALNGATLGGSKANSIILTNASTGDISGKAAVTTSATGTLTLTNSGNGNITGTSSTVGLKISTTKVNSINAKGFVNVNDAATTAMTFGTITGNQITLTTTGNTTFNSDITASGTSTGNISVVQTTGLLTVSSGVKINASGTTATVLLQEKANAATSGITLQSGVTITTAASTTKPTSPTTFPRLGQVSLIIGSTVPAPSNNTAPTGISVVTSGTATSADAFFGTTPTGIVATGTTVNIVNKSAVQMQAGTSAKITLTNVTITADPPASSAALTAPALTSLTPAHASSALKTAGNSQSLTIATPGSSTKESFSLSSNFGSNAYAMPIQTTNINNTVNPSIAKMLQGGVSETELSQELTPGFIGFGNADATFSSDKDFGFTSSASSLSSEHKVVDLAKGSVLFAPFVDTVVKTPFGDVEIAAKSVALVFSSSLGTAIFNLDDQHRDAVHVKAGEHRMHIAPGRHLTITNANIKDFGQVNAVEAIAYRNIKEQDLGNGMKVFSAEYSIPSAIASIKPLKTLCNSQHPEARKLSSHLMKTVASMLQMNRNGERYQQVFRPRMAAFNNQ